MQEKNFTPRKYLEICRAVLSTQRKIKEIESETIPVNEIQKNFGETQNKELEATKNCSRCVRTYYVTKNPAHSKIHKKCNGMNHFAKVYQSN